MPKVTHINNLKITPVPPKKTYSSTYSSYSLSSHHDDKDSSVPFAKPARLVLFESLIDKSIAEEFRLDDRIFG